MKLYAENGQVYFDYTDIDTKAETQKTYGYRRFMRETNCWNETETPQIVRMAYNPYGWGTPYGKACELKSLLGFCKVQAQCNDVEIDSSFTELCEATEKRCNELRAIEEEKEEQLKAEAKWQNLCKYGCDRCEHKRRSGDDYFCNASGDMLPEKNVPGPSGKVFQLFNYTAFPSENCPYNINKNKEIKNVQEGTKKAS